MIDQINYEVVADKIRKIYDENPKMAEISVEQYLTDILNELDPRDKINVIKKIAGSFSNYSTNESSFNEIEDEIFSKVFSLILGRKITEDDLSSKERLNRLAQSLNTIFDQMNQLVEVINQHLYREYDGDKTIRRIIGIEMMDESQGKPLEAYLGQIKTAFLVAQEAFRKSMEITVGRVVDEFNPENIELQSGGGGFRFGPLKKAEYYDTYAKKFRQVKNWFDSDRFTEDFLREFEKSCEKNLR